MLEITVAAVEEKLKNGDVLHMIDVREAEEVATGVIPGVQHIPLGEISQRMHDLDKSKPYIMICRSGGRSEQATQFLVSHGYHVKNMIGGMLEWSGPTTILDD